MIWDTSGICLTRISVSYHQLKPPSCFREFNVYGIDKDGNRRRANICPIIKSYDCPPSQTSLGTQYLQPPIDDSFFHVKSKPGLGVA